MDAGSRTREAAAAIGKRGEMLLEQFAFWEKGVAAMARQQTLMETPELGEGASKGARKDHEGQVTRKAQPYTQALVRELVTTIKALADFYAAKATDRRQPSWWKPVDPETGRVVLRSKFGAVQAVAGADLKRAA